jgi:hypothetical protein
MSYVWLFENAMLLLEAFDNISIFKFWAILRRFQAY